MRLFKFSEVVGNISIKNVIMKTLTSESYPNFSIMSGESGIGKSTLAVIAGNRLVCENPTGAEPCGVCPTCKDVKNVVLKNGTSRRFKKINLARVEKKEDMDKVIHDVFTIDQGTENTVFIFEEGHCLSPQHQTVLLEELDRIPDNVYVILCTTKITSLLKELKNRSIVYNINRLSNSDSRLLMDNLCSRYNIPVSESVKNKIMLFSKGVPRQMVNYLENYVKMGGCSAEELDALLNIVSTEDIRTLLKSYINMSNFLAYLDVLLEKSSVAELIQALKSYVMECGFLSKDLSFRKTYLSPEDKRFAKEIGFNTLMKIYGEILNLSYNCSPEDLTYSLIKCATVLRKSKKKELESAGISTSENQLEVHREAQTLYEENLEESKNFKMVNASNIKDMLK